MGIISLLRQNGLIDGCLEATIDRMWLARLSIAVPIPDLVALSEGAISRSMWLSWLDKGMSPTVASLVKLQNEWGIQFAIGNGLPRYLATPAGIAASLKRKSIPDICLALDMPFSTLIKARNGDQTIRRLYALADIAQYLKCRYYISDDHNPADIFYK